MPRNLPIALVAVDDVAHDLTRMALEDTLRHVTPEQVLIFTDDPKRIAISGAEYYPFDGGYEGAMRAIWYEVPKALRAGHWLWIQWDSWVLDEAQWTDEFLRCDYIGAPWPVEPGNLWDKLGMVKGRAVGNGGFSLRSVRLANCLSTKRDKYPLQYPEDDAICRRYRSILERDEGFVWASDDLAARFSVDCQYPPGPLFGFHGLFHWGWVLDKRGREARMAAASPWVKNRGTYKTLSEWHATADAPAFAKADLYSYNGERYDVDTLEAAKSIILMPDEDRTTDERWLHETEYLLRRIEEYVRQRGLTCLDYGCGIGRLAKPLIERKGWRVIGADFSESMRKFAIEYVNSPDSFLCCAPTALDILMRFDLRVDVAICFWALQHFQQVPEDIRRIKKCLKPGGKLFVLNLENRSVPVQDNKWLNDGIDVWKILDDEFSRVDKEWVNNTRLMPDNCAIWAVYEKR